MYNFNFKPSDTDEYPYYEGDLSVVQEAVQAHLERRELPPVPERHEAPENPFQGIAEAWVDFVERASNGLAELFDKILSDGNINPNGDIINWVEHKNSSNIKNFNVTKSGRIISVMDDEEK